MERSSTYMDDATINSNTSRIAEEMEKANPNSADHMTSHGDPLEEIAEAMNEDGALSPTPRDTGNQPMLVDPRGEITTMQDGPYVPGQQPPMDNPDMPMPNDPISNNPDVFPNGPLPGIGNQNDPNRPHTPNPEEPNELPIDPNRNAPTEPDVPTPIDPPAPGPGDPVPGGPIDPF